MSALPADAIGSVRNLIGAGKSKQALDRAKEVHKQLASPESEAALVDAYVVRVSALVETRMLVEARSLAQLVRQRFPGAAPRLEIVEGRAGLLAGDLECLKALGDPGLDPNRRDSLHGLIRRELLSPAKLADFAGLPADHSLRQAAKAIATAFTAVTSGPVGEELLQLREVSHRSPLAPWKILIQAIGAMYRRDDEACRRLLDGIDPESAAARLKAAVDAILSGRLPQGAPPAVSLLVERTGGGIERLRGMLAAADAALRNLKPTQKRGPALALARDAIKAARQQSPKVATALEEQLLARLIGVGMDEKDALSQLGAGKSNSANLIRLRALAYENGGEPDAIGAVIDWAGYHQVAVRAKLFPETGPVSSVLFLHMANLLSRVDAEMLSRIPRKLNLDPAAHWMFDRRALYRRAAEADPCPLVYRQWLAWEKDDDFDRGKSAEATALAWHRALPKDLEPLLYLADVLEERNALQKSLGYVAKAEAIDGLNADVRRARSRLLFRAACRSLKNAKPPLVEKQIAALEESAFASHGDMPGLALSLRYCLELLLTNADQADKAHLKLNSLLGQAAAPALIWNVALASQVPLDCQDILAAVPAGDRLEASARICMLGDRLGVPFEIPPKWYNDITAALRKNSSAIDSAGLLALGEAAVRRGSLNLAYAISAAGLAGDGFPEGRCLLIRARALPPFESERRNQCLAAVVTLARRQRDHALVSAAIEARRGGDRYYDDELTSSSDFSVTDEHLAALLAGERSATEYPKLGAPLAYVSKFMRLCMCPACRAERGEGASRSGVAAPFNPFDDDPFDTDEDEDFDGEEDDFDDPDFGFSPSMPRELAQLLESMPPEDAYKMLSEMAKIAGVQPPPRSLIPGLGTSRGGGAGRKRKRRGRSR